MKRRTFLKTAAAATAAASLAKYNAKALPDPKLVPNETIADDNIMIILELFGGNDGLNTIIPVYNDEYYNLRPVLAYPENMTYRFGESDVYFNPNLVEGHYNEGLLGLLKDGNLAIVEGVGYVDPNLSHFRSQDIHHSGINSSDPKVKLLSGWLGRYFEQLLPNYPLEIPEHPLSVAIDGTLPLLFHGTNGHMGIAVNDPDKFYEMGQGMTPTVPLFPTPESDYYEKEFNFVHVIAKQSEVYAQEVKNAYDIGKDKIKTSFSEGLAQKFATISALIAGGLKTKAYFVRLGNFDHHAQQMQSDFTGQHPSLLLEVANSITEFMQEAHEQGFADRIAGMTMSEFGRRAYDNGSRGTDHGAASMQFIFGGEYVNAGYYGDKPNLTELDVDGNIKHEFDFRTVFQAFLETWFGADKTMTRNVFGDDYVPLDILSPRFSSVNEPLAMKHNQALNVFPNPSNGQINITFELKRDAWVDIDIFNILGNRYKKVYSGFYSAGMHKIPVNDLNSGNYVCSIIVNKRRYTKNFIVVK